MNETKLTGNQRRLLAKPPTRDIGNGTRLIFGFTDAQVNTLRQLEALGLVKRYPSSSGFWELTDEGRNF